MHAFPAVSLTSCVYFLAEFARALCVSRAYTAGSQGLAVNIYYLYFLKSVNNANESDNYITDIRRNTTRFTLPLRNPFTL